MLYLVALLLVLLIIGLFYGIPQIGPSRHYVEGFYDTSTDSEPEPEPEPTPYLHKAKSALQQMFDHQLNYKTKNGSWLSVSFRHMPLFNKDNIWKVLINAIPAAQARKLYPQTYYLPRDMPSIVRLQEDTFILKKTHTWARQGLKIVDSKQEVLNNSREYDLAQVLVPDPDLINGYKYDIRMFLVVHYKHGIMLYKDSYFSYSNYPYDPQGKNMFSRIGGVHLSPKFYTDNKLPTRASEYTKYPSLYPLIVQMLKKIFRHYPDPLLTQREQDLNRIKIFGIDINVFRNKDGTLRPMLIEMNSNPCLLFPEADWKNKLIYGLVQDIKMHRTDKFSIIRPR